jgi:hypothetical protein
MTSWAPAATRSPVEHPLPRGGGVGVTSGVGSELGGRLGSVDGLTDGDGLVDGDGDAGAWQPDANRATSRRAAFGLVGVVLEPAHRGQ